MAPFLLHTRALVPLTLALASCGNQPVNPADAAVDTSATGGDNNIPLSPPQAFEGQRRFVGVLGPALSGDTLVNAVVTASSDAIVLDHTECTRIFCAFTAHLDDRTPNRGAAIPEPVSAAPVVLRLRGAQYNYSAQLLVLPLDTADGSALSTGLAGDALYSSMNLAAGSMLRGGDGSSPVRIGVLGDAQVHATIDLSATASAPGRGGFAGGAVPSGDGQGPLGGTAGAGAGGGGGNGTAGQDGRGVAAGGIGGMAESTRWQLAGGSGGGASTTGAGGSGGGALALAFFGAADLTGASLLVRGSDGVYGGGGGAGGLVFLSGALQGTPSIDGAGGAGGTGGAAQGGAGGQGRVRLHGPGGATVTGAVSAQAPAFLLGMIPAISRAATATLQGTAAPGARVRVQNEAGGVAQGRAEATADASGHWTMEFALGPNANALILYELVGAVAVPSFSGTTVVVRGAGGARQLYSGALELAYLQDAP